MGTKSETRLKIEDPPTSSYILEFKQAITVATTLKSKTEILVVRSKCLSLCAFLRSGFITFSEKIEAGANKDELVVLITAESNEPKKSICTGMAVCESTIAGSTN